MLSRFFQNTLMKIREWIDRMINTNDIKRALRIDETAFSDVMATALDTWSKMYVNDADWLTSDLFKPVKSLQLPATIASELARLITLEMQVNISGGVRAEFMTQTIAPILKEIKQILEQGGAKGGVIFKPYPIGREMAIDIVYADMFYPIRFNSSRKLISCVFRETIKRGIYYYTRLEYHEMGKFQDTSGNPVDGCRITNSAFRSSSELDLGQQIPLIQVPEWAGFSESGILRGAKQLPIGYYRPPIANNIDPSSPLGVSCYSRAVDLIRQADELWSQLIWEFKSGDRAIYVDETAFRKDASTGLPILPNNRLYRTLQSTGTIGENKKLFDEWSPEFRDSAYRSGLNDIFKRIEFNVGLAYGTLSDPAVVEKTATEIVNAKQRSASTVVDNQKALQDALDDLFYGISIWIDAAKLGYGGTYTVAYNFDDSIITDKQAQFTQDSLSIGQKTMGRVEFRMRNYGEDEATAKAKIAEIDADSANRVDMFANDAFGQETR